MTDSLNKSFQDLFLFEEKKTNENFHVSENSNNIFHNQHFQSQRSLTIGEDTHIIGIEDTQTHSQTLLKPLPEEEKTNLDQQIDDPQPFSSALKRKRLDNATKEELKMLKSTVEGSKQGKPVLIQLKPQRKYQVETKVKAVELCGKVGTLKVAASTSIPESTLRRWQKVGVNRVGHSGRHPKYKNIEPDLFASFMNCRAEGISVNNRYLLKEARIIAQQKDIEDFIGTLSWLEGFKRRHNIVYRRPTRVSQKLKPDSQEQLKQFQEKYIELQKKHQYDPNAIVNIDETGISMDMPSNQTLHIKVNFSLFFYKFLGEKRSCCPHNWE